MYNILTAVFISMFLVINCGGPKQETPAKSTIQSIPEFDAIVKTTTPMTVLFIEKKGPYTEAGKAIGELMSRVMIKQIKPMGMPFGIYYDDPMRVVPESTRYEVCVPVASGIKGDGLFEVRQLPAMEVASTIHTGAYDNVGITYGKLMQWINKNNYMVVGTAREFYTNNPSTSPAESLKTEIQIPIKKKG